MRVIYKYELDIVDDQHVEMPSCAQLLHVAEQRGILTLWALVDTASKLCKRKIRVIGTGNPIGSGPGVYIGTVPMANGLVWHVFDFGVVTTLKG